MKPEEIQAIRDRLEATTKWKWFAHRLGGGKGKPNAYAIANSEDWGGKEGETHLTIAHTFQSPRGKSDAKFIANAKDDILNLLEHIEILTK